MLKALLLVSCLALSAAPPPVKVGVAPLLPGEALALAGPDGLVYLFGDASTERPMGSLAKLVWLKLEGSEWGAMNLAFNCTGTWQEHHCWLPKGHGRLDLGKALAGDCDLAFLVWAQVTAQGWLRDYGDGAARARLEDAFGPFLGKRLPPGEELPVIDAPWVGMGDLLRTSAEGMLRWLVDPAQDELLRIARRHLLSFKQFNFRENAWWVQVGGAQVASAPGATSIWAVGSNGQITAVLHLPQGKSRAEGLARFRAVMIVLPDK